MKTSRILVIACLVAVLAVASAGAAAERPDGPVATFSIVARDPGTGEWGVGVASRFFAVGAVVPWAKAGVGAVATQSFMNTTFGPRGLELLDAGLSPEETLKVLLRADDNPTRRQVGIVAANGASATYTGADCIPWAGGRHGADYAVQGNILTGEAVVVSMEKAFLETKGTLAERIYAALAAGDAQGGDARGRQSAAILVVRAGAGYGGYTDRAIDIRVDDHPDPFGELGRLLTYGQMNYCWNDAWTLFTKGRAAEALPPMEKAAKLAPDNPEVFYDLAVIRLAAGRKAEALDALRRAVALNPKLKAQARGDKDLSRLSGDAAFEALVK